jgi:hypothetical protein
LGKRGFRRHCGACQREGNDNDKELNSNLHVFSDLYDLISNDLWSHRVSPVWRELRLNNDLQKTTYEKGPDGISPARKSRL